MSCDLGPCLPCYSQARDPLRYPYEMRHPHSPRDSPRAKLNPLCQEPQTHSGMRGHRALSGSPARVMSFLLPKEGIDRR